MSFFGKKFKKVDSQNMAELWDALEATDKVKAMMRQADAISSFTKNADGSIQYVVEKASGEKTLDQKIVLDQANDYKTPDDIVTKNTFTLQGDVLKSTMIFPDGKVINFDRYFEGNKLRMEITSNRTAVKGTVFYETV